MPVYDYEGCWWCETDDEERLCSIEQRDMQYCEKCGMPLRRKISFQGSVWSPTRNGGHS